MYIQNIRSNLCVRHKLSNMAGPNIINTRMNMSVFLLNHHSTIQHDSTDFNRIQQTSTYSNKLQQFGLNNHYKVLTTVISVELINSLV